MTRHFLTSAFTRQGRRAWLLCLALLWPLASTAALLHSYGHLHAVLAGAGPQASPAEAGGDDLNVHVLQGCDLCLAAAASLAGAAPAPADASPVVSLPQARALAPSALPRPRTDGPHFAARAPPAHLS
jgi:hypothetical protein